MLPRNLLYTLIAVTCFFSTAFGQKQNNNWIFDKDNGIDFNTSPASSFISNYGFTNYYIEIAATISNRKTGQLMFYTDGYKIYNRNTVPMPNGVAIGNDTPRYSSRQGVAIVPKPGDTNLYYVFTLNDIVQEGRLQYSVVHMSLDGGLGDVIPGQKNIFIDSSFAEMMTMAKGSDCSLWLILMKRAANEIYAYKITKGGLVTTPVISTFAGPANHFGSLLKVSEQNFMCFSLLFPGYRQQCLMKFDPSSGQCSDFSVINNITSFVDCYDFSPSGRYLYLVDTAAVHQYDMSLPGNGAIIGSKKSLHYGQQIYKTYCAELAPDGNIYMTNYIKKTLNMIYNTELSAFGVKLDSFQLVNNSAASLAYKVLVADEEVTGVHMVSLCDTAALRLSGPAGALSYKWQDGSSDSNFLAYNTGTYWVQSYDGCRYRTDTFMTDRLERIDLGNDTTICKGAELVLDTRDNSSAHLWSTGATGNRITVNAPGTYSVVVSRNNCSLSDSINVDVLAIKVSLPPDTGICAGTSLRLQVPDTFDAYAWNAGSGPYTDVHKAGVYWVQVAKAGCTASDTITINVLENVLDFGNDKQLCNGEVIRLQASLIAGTVYAWQDGSTGDTYDVSEAGQYWLKAVNKCGEFFDTVNVFYENCNCNAFVASAFTPNSDGLNDKISPRLDCVTSQYLFVIANRFGEIVFRSADPGQGWDGSYKDVPCDLNTYYYYLTVTGPHNRKFFFKGDILLIR